MTIGTQVDELARLKKLFKKASDAASKLEADVKAKELEITNLLDAEGTPVAGGKLGKVKIEEAVVPSYKDWDAFWTYVYRHKASHLLERRIAVRAYREEIETRKGKPLPGVESYTRRTLKFTPNS